MLPMCAAEQDPSYRLMIVTVSDMAESDSDGQIMSMTYDPMQVKESELIVSDETVEDDAQAPQPSQHRGRKCVRNPESWTKKQVKKERFMTKCPTSGH